MGRHGNIGPHYYEGLDRDHTIKVALTMREVAERVEDSNYGTQRFLSHLVDVRREHLKKRIEEYRQKGSEDVAAYVERDGDPLADAIERLLQEGYY